MYYWILFFIKGNNIPLTTIIQLPQYIERIGGSRIGLYCGSIRAITKSNIIQVNFSEIQNFF
jgi:hypothetical protein